MKVRVRDTVGVLAEAGARAGAGAGTGAGAGVSVGTGAGTDAGEDAGKFAAGVPSGSRWEQRKLFRVLVLLPEQLGTDPPLEPPARLDDGGSWPR